MKVVVFGATGATGRLAVEALRVAGHEVTAASRTQPPGVDVRWVRADATRAEDVAAAVEGQEAVVVALGIAEDALRVRLFGPSRTPIDVRSCGTRHVVDAMRRHGVRRLVVQTTYGVGETRQRLSAAWKLVFSLVLAPQIADTERQEDLVRHSGLDWVLVRPVGLTAAPDHPGATFSVDDGIVSMAVPRATAARALVRAVHDPAWVGRAVAVSAPG